MHSPSEVTEDSGYSNFPWVLVLSGGYRLLLRPLPYGGQLLPCQYSMLWF